MLKQTAIFLGMLFAFLIVFLTFERYGSPSFQSCIRQESSNKSEKITEESDISVRAIVSYARCTSRLIDAHNVGITALATVIIAAFTCTLWIATSRQSRLTLEMLRLAKNDFISTHCPRVIVRVIHEPLHDSDGTQSVAVDIVNIGPSLAIVHEFGCDLARRKGKLWCNPGADAIAKQIEPIKLVSGERRTIPVRAKAAYSEAEIFADVMETEELCAFGVVRYRDENGIVRETGIFSRLRPGKRKVHSIQRLR